MDDFGFYRANLVADGADFRDTVCPFSDDAANESEIANSLFHPEVNDYNDHLGRFISIYAGSVDTGGYRERGSSGGFTSWILTQLLEGNHVDAVIHVKPRLPTEGDKRLFKYGVSTSLQELHQGAKSHYYPVEMSEVLTHVRSTPGRYAIVGVPCFIKAIRLLSREEPLFRDRIIFTVGLFCGHLKSTGFAEMLAWQVGVHPDSLVEMDFRTKIEGRPSSSYAITATGKADGVIHRKTELTANLVGTDWGKGFFKYKACDFCDDLSAETADVSVGDAWLPKYVDDSRGTNVVIIRNASIAEIVKEGIARGTLRFEPLSTEDAVASQSANVRHRREDLPYRLHLEDLKKQWRPRKRLSASSQPLNLQRKIIQKLRIRYREQIPGHWNSAVKNNDFSVFLKLIQPLEKEYQVLYAPKQTLKQRAKSLLRKIKKMIINKRH